MNSASDYGFSFKYNWDACGYSRIANFLRKLYYNSYNNSFNLKKDEGNKLRADLPKLIQYVEDFFYAGIVLEPHFFMIKGKNGDVFNYELLSKMEENLKTISYLPKNYYDKVYGINSYGNVMIRGENDYREYGGLNREEVRRLFLFHELGHSLFGIKSNNMIQSFYKETATGLNFNPKLFGCALLMIEECLAQELAEELAFAVAKKKRQPYQLKKDLGCFVRDNYIYYGIFQQPLIDFGRTLDGCGGNKVPGNVILANMIKKALTSDFVSDIISEYRSKKNSDKLRNIFVYMGNLCYMKYRSFGEILIKDYKLAPKATPENLLKLINVTCEHICNVINSEHNLENETPKSICNIPKPRYKLENETDKEYIAYLNSYFEKYFKSGSIFYNDVFIPRFRYQLKGESDDHYLFDVYQYIDYYFYSDYSDSKKRNVIK